MTKELSNLFSNISSQADTFSDEDISSNTDQHDQIINCKRKNVDRPRERIWDYYITSSIVGSRFKHQKSDTTPITIMFLKIQTLDCFRFEIIHADINFVLNV
ncbi:13015_t:CDS:2 [Gigaspora margarita]|uniref:13015_t:CDS:1 n=1 Tax=Gigaspora margarita TaxID=4874 RepID=A0ABN7VNU5_GIGMA|nr:13015_t:CDS:2 [Gigaspora margarita]